MGGGLLREPAKIGGILAALRGAVAGLFTVKMRLGFLRGHGQLRADPRLGERASRSSLLSHATAAPSGKCTGATIMANYIARAVAVSRCPVLANGNLTSASQGRGRARGDLAPAAR